MFLVVALLGMPKIRKNRIKKHARSCFLSSTLQRNEMSGCMGKRHIISLKEVKVLDIDSTKLHGIGMPQPLPLAKKTLVTKKVQKKTLSTPYISVILFVWEVDF